MQISLTSLTNQKNNSSTNQGTSEGPETSEQEYLTKRIQIYCAYLCSDIIWKVILEKEVKMDHTKIGTAYLDSPCQELSDGGLGIVVALLVRWGIDFCVRALGVQSSCRLNRIRLIKYSCAEVSGPSEVPWFVREWIF